MKTTIIRNKNLANRKINCTKLQLANNKALSRTRMEEEKKEAELHYKDIHTYKDKAFQIIWVNLLLRTTKSIMEYRISANLRIIMMIIRTD